VALVSSIGAALAVAAGLARADRSTSTATTATPRATPPSTAAGPTADPDPGSSSQQSSGNSSTGYTDGVYTGPAESTRWGDVQVQVTIQNGKIVSVDEVQAPSDRRSAAINSRAQPVLESEAVAAQSADIDAVSGATYTSDTYKASLQAALDQAAQSVPAG